MRIQFDTEFEDDGLFSVTFWFDRSTVPSYLTIARDEVEEPNFVYVEAEDQKYGFKTNDLKFTVNDGEIELFFDPQSDSLFYWNNSKRLVIEIPPEDMRNVERYLNRICK